MQANTIGRQRSRWYQAPGHLDEAGRRRCAYIDAANTAPNATHHGQRPRSSAMSRTSVERDAAR
jgi:hypothetical protein